VREFAQGDLQVMCIPVMKTEFTLMSAI